MRKLLIAGIRECRKKSANVEDLGICTRREGCRLRRALSNERESTVLKHRIFNIGKSGGWR